ncbi:MAG: NAD-dependent epimerase/dehydratase family protein [Novosphingobium sp.]
MSIALTGATGFVGQALLDTAQHAGTPLRALARREQAGRSGVDWLGGDLADRAALKALVTGTEAVIHVAGVVNAPDPAGFEAGNVTGTLELVEAALAAGVPRFVFVSSLAAREPQLSAYGASKQRAEKIVMASGLDWTIVRPPAIYGPRDREMFELFRAARWGVVPLPPPGRLSLIHAEDLARLLLALVPGGEDVTHRILEPDDGRENGWNNRELARLIGAAVGRRPWTPHMSRPLLRGAARIDGMLRRGRAKLTADRVRYMAHPDWVVSKGARPPAALWTPRIETREGMKATARWYRAQGWL